MREDLREDCGNCRYCRIDEDANQPYCKQTYTNVSLDSSACESFEEDD